MITLPDLIKHGTNITDEQRSNAKLLIPVVNYIEEYLGLDFESTSGIRDMSEHLAIYKVLQAQDVAQGKPARPIPMRSSHLVGNALDFVSPKLNILDLQALFLREEMEEIYKKVGAWFERFDFTKTWIHIQRVPPASGNRFFKPF
jgi:hypothetical protein